ncbi:MAG: DUF362 domain-containing protein [Actinomycetia bacterium]|nr:DUF362 domain-containing protein [Actinomycetes bacterium]
MRDIDRREFIVGSLGATALLLSGCSSSSSRAAADSIRTKPSAESTSAPTGADQALPKVYFTTNISPTGLVAAFEALQISLPAKTAVKLSTGEAGGNNYLKPALIKDLVRRLDATIVECNTAYAGSRSDVKGSFKTAADHGFTAIADVDIQDADGELLLPVTSGVHLTHNRVGSHFSNYTGYLSLAHFKGHSMAGLGGAIKNIAIGIASAKGKSLIHSGGARLTGVGAGTKQEAFLEAMAEAAKSIVDHLGNNIAFVNVMNNLSIDCDCSSHPAKPKMADIGVLSSLDPLALDQACVDLVYAAPDGSALIKRMESRNGLHTLEYGESIGLGSRKYELLKL